MSYSELFKSFGRIRDYMREFYVFGFKSREEYDRKSARSYDDERRRMESLLGDHMRFYRTPEGKTVFLSIDSRVSAHNPLYKAWRAKSFTDGDVTLHFLLLDLLTEHPGGLLLPEICDGITERLPDEERLFDESTVRKKLKEYVGEGIVITAKAGKSLRYFLAPPTDLSSAADALDFFSEVAPCGVIGSYLPDPPGGAPSFLRFKHHYVTASLDSEILCSLLEAMGEKRSVSLEVINRRRERVSETAVVPLRVMVSVSLGRQFLMAYVPAARRITSIRIDHILSVKSGDVCPDFDARRTDLDRMQAHLWGVSTSNTSRERLQSVEMTVCFGDDETFILQRLEREKRCGRVERLDDHTARFTAEVFDVRELFPWLRTFLCRIRDIRFSDPEMQKQFREDTEAMYALYGITESAGEEADV